MNCKPASDYVIVITGDIVENANHEEQTVEAVDAIDLMERQGYRVLSVPGNHDYGTGILGDMKFVSLFKKNFFRSRRISYPKLDIIDDVAFLGLDSTAEELHFIDRFLSQGELGKPQLNRLKRMLDMPDVAGCKKVLYMHHHPFDFKPGMQLKDSDNLKTIVKDRIDILLFGHYHKDPESAEKSYHGKWGIPRCYNAGSSSHKNGDIGSQRIINISALDPSEDYDGNFI
jgi:predicted MPP superfamily phosphohydrolase